MEFGESGVDEGGVVAAQVQCAGDAAVIDVQGAGRDKERTTVERCFARLKQFRAVATRYDKREFMYQGTVDLASIRIWLRDPVP